LQNEGFRNTMLQPLPSRAWLAVAAASLLFAGVSGGAQTTPPPKPHPHAAARPVTSNAQHLPPAVSEQQAPAPVVRRPPATQQPMPQAQVSANPHPAPTGALPPGQKPGADMYGKGEHLTAWMSAHSNMTLPQQQAALEKEPGFRDLPAPTQQRIRNRLTELSTMSPEKRARVLARNEQIERLTPDQRAQVRGAMTQLGSLPPDQQKTVYRAFRDLRGLPPQERLPILNSERYRNLNPAQRATLQRLMQVEPILPRDDVAPQR